MCKQYGFGILHTCAYNYGFVLLKDMVCFSLELVFFRKPTTQSEGR